MPIGGVSAPFFEEPVATTGGGGGGGGDASAANQLTQIARAETQIARADTQIVRADTQIAQLTSIDAHLDAIDTDTLQIVTNTASTASSTATTATNTATIATNTAATVTALGTEGAAPPALVGTGVLKYLRGIYETLAAKLGWGFTSTLNSTSVNLAANATFRGVSELCENHGLITVAVRSSHGSATNGLFLEWLDDAGNVVGTSDAYTVPANTFRIYSFNPPKRYRTVYTNGATGTTSLFVQTGLRSNGVPSSHRINEALTDETDSIMVKAAITGRTNAGAWPTAIMGTDSRLGVSTRATLSPANSYVEVTLENDNAAATGTGTPYVVPAGKTLYITSAWISSSQSLSGAGGAGKIAIAIGARKIVGVTHAGAVTDIVGALVSNQNNAQTFAEPFQVAAGNSIDMAWNTALPGTIGGRTASGGFVGYLQ